MGGDQQAYFNFINSLQSEETKRMYVYCLEQFLLAPKVPEHKEEREELTKQELGKFLAKPAQQQTNIIIQYLVQKKVSKGFKNLIFATIRHACEINDVVLNWKKIKKFARPQKTGNEILGKDRGYTHEEIEKIISLSEQRFKTAFLILASTGIRIGALGLLKVGDLERIDDLYKVTVYSGEKEEYITFTTPEAAKEIDIYLEFRKHRGENITSDSYLIVKKFRQGQKTTPFKGNSLHDLLKDVIDNTGLRQVDHNNPYKRKEVALLHGFRKFFTKQLMDSKVDKAIIELLLGHDIGLTGRYYKPTEKEMLNEYLKAVTFINENKEPGGLTISNEERLKFKLEERVQIQKTQMETMQEQMNAFQKELKELKSRKRK